MSAPVVVLDPAWPIAVQTEIRRLVAVADLPADALVLATSGSTGSPRCVVRTTASWRDSFAAFSDLAGIGSDARVLVPGPMSSTMFRYAATHARWAGAAVVEDAPTTSSPWTAAHVLPRQLGVLLTAAVDLVGRTVIVAGAALDPGLRSAAEARGLRVVEYYGSAEASFVAVDLDGGGLRAFPGVEVDVDGGEIRARSPYLASAVLGGDLAVTADGWLRTGDLGSLEDGRLTVLGRADLALLVGGATVAVEPVERVLRTVPGVADAVVVGVPHPDLGSVLAAVVERGDVEPSPSALRRVVGERLTAPARPRRWLVVDALPRTPSGKPDRAAAAATAGSGALR